MDVHQVNSRALHDSDVEGGDEVDEISPAEAAAAQQGTGDELEKRVTSASAASWVETYPEGGLQAWSVVAGSWFALFSSLGLMNTIGTFQAYALAHQLSGYSEGTVGWVFSLYTFLAFFCGVYIGPIFDKYGPRWLVIAGAIFTVGGMIFMSFCTGPSYPCALTCSLLLHLIPTNTLDDVYRAMALHHCIRSPLRLGFIAAIHPLDCRRWPLLQGSSRTRHGSCLHGRRHRRHHLSSDAIIPL